VRYGHWNVPDGVDDDGEGGPTWPWPDDDDDE
jgi:hypothetical protein